MPDDIVLAVVDTIRQAWDITRQVHAALLEYACDIGNILWHAVAILVVYAEHFPYITVTVVSGVVAYIWFRSVEEDRLEEEQLRQQMRRLEELQQEAALGRYQYRLQQPSAQQ